MVEFQKIVPTQTSFDPELVEVLASALDDAWCRIEQSGSRFARAGYSRAMREVIAKQCGLAWPGRTTSSPIQP